MNSYFKFKQFIILQDRCAMKVGTDGVLLGAWCSANGTNALDIGTGTGVVAIMLAQRNSRLNVVGIEIDEDAAMQASKNMKHSPWDKRLSCLHSDFRTFSNNTSQKFDLIVSNPPYFIDSLKGPIDTRNVARHADELPYLDLMRGVDQILNTNGIFSLVMPYVEGNLFIATASEYGLHCTRKTNVYSKKGKNIKRLLLEFKRTPADTLRESQLYIEGEELNSFTPEYQALTKDFYLKF
jgi:tRNA1Val (adenine37-N6)-methyltransferase